LKEFNIRKVYFLTDIMHEEVFRETCVGQISDTEIAIAPIIFRLWP